nr:acyl-CoA dehydrogenase family protein [uncultured Cupriavidus sp.]
MGTSVWKNDELEILRDNARRFYETELLPNEDRWARQQCVDRDVWYKAGEAGLLCVGIPEEYGGGGGNFLHEAVIFAEQARTLCPGLGNSVHSGIVAHYIRNFASEAQKQQWLPKMARGELVAALAITEPAAGSDVQSIRTQARRDGDHYVINGAKTYITNGSTANLICVVVKTDPSQGARGISIIVVETDKVEGFRRGRTLSKVGLHSQDTAELFFDEVRVPCENLLGDQEGQGFKQLMKELSRERVITAFVSMACMERAIEETLNFTSTRQVFGVNLLSMQNTRFKLAECETKLTLARTLLDHCASKLLEGALDGSTAAMAKWWVTDACGEVVDDCVQLHGGAGYMLEYPVARLYQNVRIHRILAGTNEIMKELIARDLEKRLR